MPERNTNQVIAKATTAAGNEKMKSPPIIQKNNAVRHEPGGGVLRRAKVAAAVGANDYFTANLYHATTGVEQTTGNEAGVTVYCNISDPSDTGLGLNRCIRLLSVGDIVEVVRHAYDNAGTPEYKWYAVEGFAAFKNCVCTEPT